MERGLKIARHVCPGGVTDVPAKAESTHKGKYSEEEWQLRVDLAAAYRLVAHFGWDEMIYNHLTARVPGPNAHFLINPFGLRFDEITASSLVKIDTEGNVIDKGSTEFGVNQAGFVIHSAVHLARDDLHSVMHVHTVPGMAVASMKCGFLPHICQNTSVAAAGGISYHTFEGIAVSEGERVRIQKDLGPTNKILILRNHGILTAGNTVAEAFFWLYYMLKSCEVQVAVLSSGGQNIINHVPSEIVGSAKTLMSQLTGSIGQKEFAAFKRLLDSKDPSYKL